MTEHETELVRRLREPDDNGRIGCGQSVRCAAASLIETASPFLERHLALLDTAPAAMACINDPDRGATVTAHFETLADAQDFHAAIVVIFNAR